MNRNLADYMELTIINGAYRAPIARVSALDVWFSESSFGTGERFMQQEIAIISQKVLDMP